MKTKLALSISISTFLLLAAVYYSFSSQIPFRISKIDAPLTEFSTERALVHLKKIAQKPHYIGTEEHTLVRNYLVTELEKLGLEVTIQKQLGVHKKARRASMTKNILARIKGSANNEKTLVLMTHYDSAIHASFGASDAGSGLVTIIEGIRAFLAKNKQAANDIIILFTDAEEEGLLGAEAFVNHHPWAKDVGLVLNFEARGSGGPSYMLLETNGGNTKLIRAFNQAKANYPIGNSLMYSIYKILPNDTDLTVFREEASINGFNFAFIGDHFDYHTAGDSYENVDASTIEQQGDYLITMLDYFGNTDLSVLDNDAESVYFDFPIPFLGKQLFIYPFCWVLPMFILGFLLFVAIIFVGFRANESANKLNFSGIFAGFVPFVGTLILSSVVAFYGWKFIQIIHPSYKEILHGFTYNGYWYIAVFATLTVGMCFGWYKRYFEKYTAENLMIAPLFFWGLINGAIAILLKGAGFFIFSFYIGLLFLVIALFSKQGMGAKVILLTILFCPVLFVFVPFIKIFPVGLGLNMLMLSTIFIVLLFGLLIPLFYHYKNTTKLSILFLSASVLILFVASSKAGYSKDKLQPTSLIYLLDADKNQAYWASYESEVNDFNKPYLGDHPIIVNKEKEGLHSFVSKYKLYQKTNPITLAEPLMDIISDTIIDQKRRVHLQIIPQRKMHRIDLKALNPIHFQELNINGQSLLSTSNDNKQTNILRYYLTEENEVLNLTFSISDNDSLSMKIRTISYDLFTNKELNVNPRTDETMMPTPFIINDAIIVEKTVW